MALSRKAKYVLGVAIVILVIVVVAVPIILIESHTEPINYRQEAEGKLRAAQQLIGKLQSKMTTLLEEPSVRFLPLVKSFQELLNGLFRPAVSFPQSVAALARHLALLERVLGQLEQDGGRMTRQTFDGVVAANADIGREWERLAAVRSVTDSEKEAARGCVGRLADARRLLDKILSSTTAPNTNVTTARTAKTEQESLAWTLSADT